MRFAAPDARLVVALATGPLLVVLPLPTCHQLVTQTGYRRAS
jgi:hypothetical protein